jgi:hypothetical protein
MMASSTTSPMAKINPKRVRRFTENPRTYITIKAPRMETGMAKVGTIVK